MSSIFWECKLVKDAAELYATVGDPVIPQLAGYHRPAWPNNAGNEYSYQWDSASTALDDGFNVIQPTAITGSNPGRWMQIQTGLMPQINTDQIATQGPAKILNRTLSKRATTDAAGAFTWTFSKPFPTGVVPVIEITPEDATSGVTINHKITAINNTAVSIQLGRQAPVTVLGISVLGVASNVATNIHLLAAYPTD